MVWKPVLQTGKGSLLGNMLDGPEMKFDWSDASQELTISLTISRHYFLMHALHCFKCTKNDFCRELFSQNQ